MTKYRMASRIAKMTGMRESDALRVFHMLLNSIMDVLVIEGRIELRNFGVFEVRKRPARKALNPRTGERVFVPAKRFIRFKPGKLMQENVR